MNKCELFPGWELMTDVSGYGFERGIGITRVLPDGRKRRHVARVDVVYGLGVTAAYEWLRQRAGARKPNTISTSR